MNPKTQPPADMPDQSSLLEDITQSVRRAMEGGHTGEQILAALRKGLAQSDQLPQVKLLEHRPVSGWAGGVERRDSNVASSEGQAPWGGSSPVHKGERHR